MMKREHISRIFSKIPTLTTDRFVLRRLSPDDSDDMTARDVKTHVIDHDTIFIAERDVFQRNALFDSGQNDSIGFFRQ